MVAIWLAVGLGYLVRSGLGLRLGGLAASSTAMVAMLVCLAAFGIMFVLLTWALEATSYCMADDDGRWHARPELAVKPHLAALLPIAEPLDSAGLPPGASRYCGDDRVLRGGSRLSAPWNLALLAASASGGVSGAALARPHATGTVAWIVAAAAGLAGGVVLARRRSSRGRWAVAAGWFLVVVAAGRWPGRAFRSWPACRGWSWPGCTDVLRLVLPRPGPGPPGLRAGPRTSSTPRLPAQKDGTGLSLALGQPRPGPP